MHKYLMKNTYASDEVNKNRDKKLKSKLATFGFKLLDNTKRITRNLIFGCTILVSACSSKTKNPNVPNNVFVTPYRGEILQDERGARYMANRFIAIFNPGVTEQEAQEVIMQIRGRITGKITNIEAYEIEVDGNIEEAMGFIRFNPKVFEVGKNYFAEPTVTLDNEIYMGEESDGLWWSSIIQLPEAYRAIEDAGIHQSPITVAVIDTSFDLELSELKNRYVDRSYHYDFGDSNFDRPDRNVNNEDMWDLFNLFRRNTLEETIKAVVHGTETSCLVACENNGSLIDGVSFSANILPLKIASRNRFMEYIGGMLTPLIVGDDFRIAAALIYAYILRDEVNLGVVNLSLAFPSGLIQPPIATKEAVKLLYDNGIILVASAGNDNADAANYYPAAFPQVISVGATQLVDGQEERAIYGASSGSNFSNSIDALGISAPGRGVLSVLRYPQSLELTLELLFGRDFPNNEVPIKVDGTSFSSPIVAGAAALLRSINPSLDGQQMLDVLRETADEINTDKGIWKRVNVYHAVQRVISQVEQERNCRELANGSSFRNLDMEGDILAFEQREGDYNTPQVNYIDLRDGLLRSINTEGLAQATIHPRINGSKMAFVGGPAGIDSGSDFENHAFLYDLETEELRAYNVDRVQDVGLSDDRLLIALSSDGFGRDCASGRFSCIKIYDLMGNLVETVEYPRGFILGDETPPTLFSDNRIITDQADLYAYELGSGRWRDIWMLRDLPVTYGLSVHGDRLVFVSAKNRPDLDHGGDAFLYDLSSNQLTQMSSGIDIFSAANMDIGDSLIAFEDGAGGLLRGGDDRVFAVNLTSRAVKEVFRAMHVDDHIYWIGSVATSGNKIAFVYDDKKIILCEIR